MDAAGFELHGSIDKKVLKNDGEQNLLVGIHSLRSGADLPWDKSLMHQGDSGLLYCPERSCKALIGRATRFRYRHQRKVADCDRHIAILDANACSPRNFLPGKDPFVLVKKWSNSLYHGISYIDRLAGTWMYPRSDKKGWQQMHDVKRGFHDEWQKQGCFLLNLGHRYQVDVSLQKPLPVKVEVYASSQRRFSIRTLGPYAPFKLPFMLKDSKGNLMRMSWSDWRQHILLNMRRRWLSALMVGDAYTLEGFFMNRGRLRPSICRDGYRVLK
jgi:hypothetical protein